MVEPAEVTEDLQPVVLQPQIPVEGAEDQDTMLLPTHEMLVVQAAPAS